MQYLRNVMTRFVLINFCSFLTIFVACYPGKDVPKEPFYFETTVFEGRRDYPVVRIPGMIESAAGTILAFAEGRESLYDHGDIDIILRRSEDNGKTWGPLMVVFDFGTETAGNPTPVLDKETGRIWLPFCTNTSEDKYFRRVWVTWSDDDGLTWADPKEITADVKPEDWFWYATGPGRGIQMESGRLVIPSNHADVNRVRRSHVIYSDDHGQTWKRGGAAGVGTDESHVAELADGTLIMNSRYQGDALMRAVTYSDDGGETWGETTLDERLIDPHCQGSLMMTPHGLVFANAATEDELPRSNLTVRISPDGGETWPVFREITDGPSAYSALSYLPDGNIGILWESGEILPYDRIQYASFNVEWVEAEPDDS